MPIPPPQDFIFASGNDADIHAPARRIIGATPSETGDPARNTSFPAGSVMLTPPPCTSFSESAPQAPAARVTRMSKRSESREASLSDTSTAFGASSVMRMIPAVSRLIAVTAETN